MAKISTTLSIDADVMAQAQAFFASLGMDLSTAVNLLLRQAVSERAPDGENDAEALEDAGLLSFAQGAAIPREIPNAETLAAFAELDNGGGHRFTGSTEELFAELMED